jgi:hypothetical protein
MSRLNITNVIRVKRREIQSLRCSKRFNFSNAYSAQDSHLVVVVFGESSRLSISQVTASEPVEPTEMKIFERCPPTRLINVKNKNERKI